VQKEALCGHFLQHNQQCQLLLVGKPKPSNCWVILIRLGEPWDLTSDMLNPFISFVFVRSKDQSAGLMKGKIKMKNWCSKI